MSTVKHISGKQYTIRKINEKNPKKYCKVIRKYYVKSRCTRGGGRGELQSKSFWSSS